MLYVPTWIKLFIPNYYDLFQTNLSIFAPIIFTDNIIYLAQNIICQLNCNLLMCL